MSDRDGAWVTIPSFGRGEYGPAEVLDMQTCPEGSTWDPAYPHAHQRGPRYAVGQRVAVARLHGAAGDVVILGPLSRTPWRH